MAGVVTDCACCANRICLECVGISVIIYFSVNLAFHFTDEGQRYYGADGTMWYVNVTVAVFSILAAIMLMVGAFIESTKLINIFIMSFSAFCVATMIIHAIGLTKTVSTAKAAKEWSEKCEEKKEDTDDQWCKDNKPDTKGMEIEDWIVSLRKGIVYSALNIAAVFVIWLCTTCKAWGFNRHISSNS